MTKFILFREPEPTFQSIIIYIIFVLYPAQVLFFIYQNDAVSSAGI